MENELVFQDGKAAVSLDLKGLESVILKIK